MRTPPGLIGSPVYSCPCVVQEHRPVCGCQEAGWWLCVHSAPGNLQGHRHASGHQGVPPLQAVSAQQLPGPQGDPHSQLPGPQECAAAGECKPLDTHSPGTHCRLCCPLQNALQRQSNRLSLLTAAADVTARLSCKAQQGLNARRPDAMQHINIAHTCCCAPLRITTPFPRPFPFPSMPPLRMMWVCTW